MENIEIKTEKSDVEKTNKLRICIQRLIQNSDFSVERLTKAKKEINDLFNSEKFGSEASRHAWISGYTSATVEDCLRWFSSMNAIAEEAYDNIIECNNDNIEFDDSKFDKHLLDCVDGIKLAKENGTCDGSFVAAEFIRGSINDLTKALEYIGFEREALNIRNQIEALNKNA